MQHGDSPSRKLGLVTALLLAGVFAAGALTGAGVHRWASPSRRLPLEPFPQFIQDLHPSPAQESKAREIGERYRPKLEAILQEIEPRVSAVQDEMEAELSTILDEEQRRQLADFRAQRRQVHLRPPGMSESREPPPAAAIEACRGKSAAADCSFITAGRAVNGRCLAPPDASPGSSLACAPPGDGER
jgi:phage host-nuclease inhibitor protein Gam